MRASLLLLAPILFFATASFAQDSLKALFNEGIALHDKGDYEGAIKKYDEVIKQDNNFSQAWYEKSLSLYKWAKYQDCADWCRSTLRKFGDIDQNKKDIYVNYGSALDALGKPDEALAIYNEGIKKYPDFYLLVFNRGITRLFRQNYDDAVIDFEKSISLNPVHASSHRYLASSIYRKNKMAAVLSLSTYLLLEPKGEWAEKNLQFMLQLLGANVEKKDDKTINISLSPDALNGKNEDDFHLVELMISLQGATDLSEKSKGLSAAQKLQSKLESFASLSAEGKTGGKKGFFTRFYIPFIAEMKKNGYLETASNIMFNASTDETAQKWLVDNKNKVVDFYTWLSAYKWHTTD